MKNLLLLSFLLLFSCTPYSNRSNQPIEPSIMSVEAGIAALETYKTMPTTDQYMDVVRTVPILVSDDAFHWMMSNGSIWTKLIPNADGNPKIIGWKSQVIESVPH